MAAIPHVSRWTLRSETVAERPNPGNLRWRSARVHTDDLAGIYVFLASDHAASITGQAINVDHGEFLA